MRLALILMGVAVFIIYNTVFIVHEGRQAIKTEFGKPVGDPITKPGLAFKTPFIQDVRFVDKRILRWDGYPNQITTKDKKFIFVDTTARWKIVDALKFIQSVQNEQGARSRLDAILDSNTREVISKHNLVEVVRNTNRILDSINKNKKEAKENQVDEEVTGQVEKISVGREELSQMIIQRSKQELIDLGIEIIDVQLKQIAYEKTVESKVYERMISERLRIAEKIRSIGKGEKAKIEGRLEKDLRDIKSQAYKRAQIIKGQAEAKAISIYAKALSRDPKFYEFIRSMESYKKSLGEKTKLILSNDLEYFKLLKNRN